MLRTLTGARRKFSFDLALHRSREKKQDAEAERGSGRQQGRGVVRTPTSTPHSSRKSTPRSAARAEPCRSNTTGSTPPQAPARMSSSNRLSEQKSFVGPAERTASEDETRQSWLRMHEARKRTQSPVGFRPSEESARRGRTSARGDDAPRIRELSRGASRTPAEQRPRSMTAEAAVAVRDPPSCVGMHNNTTLQKLSEAGPSQSRPPAPPRREVYIRQTERDSETPCHKPKHTPTRATTPPEPPGESVGRGEKKRRDFKISDVSVSGNARVSSGGGAAAAAAAERIAKQGEATDPHGSHESPTQQQEEKKKNQPEEEKKKQQRKLLMLQEPPSWQQLKTKALEADFSSMVDFIEQFEHRRASATGRREQDSIAGFFGLVTTQYLDAESSPHHQQQQLNPPVVQKMPAARAQSATRAPQSADAAKETRGNEGPTFDKWFTDRFPENNLSSAPTAHKALWAEYERQARYRRIDARRRPASKQPDEPSYLDRLRGSRSTKGHRQSDASCASPVVGATAGGLHDDLDDDKPRLTFKSGSVESPGRLRENDYDTGGEQFRSTLHTVTWKVERWSALPSGFRQGARYRPPGGAPWSLDLYKGGIKRERPGMIALYVHYDPPRAGVFATVTSLELSLMNQTTGAHLMRKHEGTRVFGPNADPKRRVSTSAGTASLAHVVVTQVEALGFCVNDTVVLRAEIEVLADNDS